jgi:hypothetical protein
MIKKELMREGKYKQCKGLAVAKQECANERHQRRKVRYQGGFIKTEWARGDNFSQDGSRIRNELFLE